MDENLEHRREEFSIALSNGKALGPTLDPVSANSPRADELRAEGVEEKLLATEIRRGLIDSKPGIDHIRYLKLASEWLGYRENPVSNKDNSGISTLAGAVAGALVGAREAGLMKEKVKKSRNPLGTDAINIIDMNKGI